MAKINNKFPTLFGQNQLKNGFGPVYAIPSFPWKQQGTNQSSKPVTKDKGNQSGHRGQHSVGQVMPALFDQNQLMGNFGRPNAEPPFPWHRSPNHGYVSGQWQQWNHFNSANMPWWNSHSFGNPFYR
ncbi:hypothetical protein V7147_18725 [Bacillus sp. JJ1521]|uniref:hypothetical protein n=1 Tax=Bacillus sp. JJ1521 TaxID=3122957 RepID=UPI002FFEB0BD